MQYFPAFLDLRGRACLVVGAGQVGRRKIARLLECQPARIRIVDPHLPEGLEAELSERPGIELCRRPFRPGDLDGTHLVFAGTSDAETNAEISRLCGEQGIFCNIADQPEQCSFIVPALVQRDDLLIAVSTQGASPALARKIRAELQERYGPAYAAWLTLLRCLRPVVINLGLSATTNRDIFRELTDETILSHIQAGDRDGVQRLLRHSLPPEAHSHIEDCLHELF